MLIGAALALKGSSRLPVAVLGDGDTMMAASAFWTAAHYKLPFVAIVSNNRSFFNDEIHQERVARQRQRPVENKWIGQRIDEPDIDIAAIARAQGLVGIGPIRTVNDLRQAVGEAEGRQSRQLRSDRCPRRSRIQSGDDGGPDSPRRRNAERLEFRGGFDGPAAPSTPGTSARLRCTAAR